MTGKPSRSRVIALRRPIPVQLDKQSTTISKSHEYLIGSFLLDSPKLPVLGSLGWRLKLRDEKSVISSHAGYPCVANRVGWLHLQSELVDGPPGPKLFALLRTAQLETYDTALSLRTVIVAGFSSPSNLYELIQPLITVNTPFQSETVNSVWFVPRKIHKEPQGEK